MKANGQSYLKELASLPKGTLERWFAETSLQLGLGTKLGRDELQLLYDAAFFAALCNVAFNGLGGCGAKPEDEGTRLELETDFLAARDTFYASPGWQNLPESERGQLERIFLTVRVNEENLAW